MRLIDVDEAKVQIRRMQTLKPSEKNLLALALDRTPTYEQPNDPLTLAELREMDGEPVYDNSGNCFIVRIKASGTDGYGADKFATYTRLDILCKCGLYRRRPEER